MLGLPPGVTACLLDLDGVLTDTAKVHAKAWKEMFDAFLRERAGAGGHDFRPFDACTDYEDLVDGRPRYDGVRSFLESRGITLRDGTPDDPPDTRTIDGLGNRKNELALSIIGREDVEAHEGSVRYVRAARDAGLRRAVVSSSTNARDVLQAAEILELFDAIVDGNIAREDHLAGKPAPATFFEGARRLGTAPAHAAVYEDALAGVEAGRTGHFGYVIGVDRVGHGDALRQHGADKVVRDLDELLGSP